MAELWRDAFSAGLALHGREHEKDLFWYEGQNENIGFSISKIIIFFLSTRTSLALVAQLVARMLNKP